MDIIILDQGETTEKLLA